MPSKILTIKPCHAVYNIRMHLEVMRVMLTCNLNGPVFEPRPGPVLSAAVVRACQRELWTEQRKEILNAQAVVPRQEQVAKAVRIFLHCLQEAQASQSLNKPNNIE